jgi:hypothetical protein
MRKGTLHAEIINGVGGRGWDHWRTPPAAEDAWEVFFFDILLV